MRPKQYQLVLVRGTDGPEPPPEPDDFTLQRRDVDNIVNWSSALGSIVVSACSQHYFALGIPTVPKDERRTKIEEEGRKEEVWQRIVLPKER